MKRNRAIAIVLIISMLCTLVQGFQGKNVQAENAEDFIYNIEKGKVTITGYTGDITGDLIIPDYIEGYPVTVIGDSAFDYGAEKDAFLGGRLQLSANLKRIESHAFNECRFFGELKLPDGLEYIGAYAFARCIYFSGDLIIPDSVTDVMSGAFYEDSGFKGRLRLSNNMRVIHERTFYWCRGFTGRLVLPEGLRGIKKCGFDALENITEPVVIPDSVIYLEDYAFSACRNIKAIYIPATVSAIVPTALSIGSENTVYTPAGSVAYETVTSNVLESYNNAKCMIANSAEEMMQMLGFADTPTPAPTEEPTVTHVPSSTEAPNDFNYTIINDEVTIISYNGDITGDLIIPDYIEGYPVTVIGDSAFDYGTELHAFIDGRLQLPENLKRIGQHAFCGCCFGESLSLPEGLEYIGAYAFSDCGFLSGDLIIPDSVTEIGGMAFRHDSGFDGILKLSNQLKVINEMTFYYCSGFKGVLDLPDNLQGIRYSAFYGANHLDGPVVIPDSVEFIERSAFAACNINAMYVPATVTDIGKSALGIGGDGNTVYTPKDSLAYQIVTTDDYGNGSPTECRIANSAEEMMQMLGLADTPTPATTKEPTATPTATPTLTPIPSPTSAPTATPTKAPTPNPTVTPSPQPSSEPTMRPTTEPTDETTLVLPTSGPEGEAKFEQKGISTTMIPIPADTPAEPATIPAPTTAPKKDNNTLSAPVFSLKKKVSSGKQKYIQIKLNRYAGSYIEVYVKVDNRSYVKLKLAENKISKIKKSLKFSYSFSKHTLYFKLRTYKKIGKKIIYSKKSKEKRIRV